MWFPDLFYHRVPQDSIGKKLPQRDVFTCFCVTKQLSKIDWTGCAKCRFCGFCTSVAMNGMNSSIVGRKEAYFAGEWDEKGYRNVKCDSLFKM